MKYVFIFATGFAQLNYLTKLPISTFEGLVCRHALGICHVILTHSWQNCNFLYWHNFIIHVHNKRKITNISNPAVFR